VTRFQWSTLIDWVLRFSLDMTRSVRIIFSFWTELHWDYSSQNPPEHEQPRQQIKNQLKSKLLLKMTNREILAFISRYGATLVYCYWCTCTCLRVPTFSTYSAVNDLSGKQLQIISMFTAVFLFFFMLYLSVDSRQNVYCFQICCLHPLEIKAAPEFFNWVCIL
jgi:hypothetical protein